MDTLALANFGKTLSTLGIWYFGLLIARFKSQGSMHTFNFPVFCTTTKLLIQSVGLVFWIMIPSFSISSIFSLSFWTVLMTQVGGMQNWSDLWINLYVIFDGRATKTGSYFSLIKDWRNWFDPSDIQPCLMHVLPLTIFPRCWKKYCSLSCCSSWLWRCRVQLDFPNLQYI